MVRMGTYRADMTARSDSELVTMLALRPDLAVPEPATLSVLIAHATSRASILRALSELNGSQLQVLEAVSVLASVSGPPSVAEISAAVTGDPHSELPDVAYLWNAGLLWRHDRAPQVNSAFALAPGVIHYLGRYPAGFGPVVEGAAVTLATEAPRGAEQILEKLKWGPPVGETPSSPGGLAAVRWLLEQDLLVEVDADHVALPRSTALALRGGRTHQALAVAPAVAPEQRDRSAVDTLAALAAEAAVRLVMQLLADWQHHAPTALRSGGLGVRELHRNATLLDVPEATAAAVIELAARTGLIQAEDDEPIQLSVTAEEWLSLAIAQQWAPLVRSWMTSPRTPWTVGSRDKRGTSRPALGADQERAWVPDLRRRVLRVLADRPGQALSTADVHALVQWQTPRVTRSLDAVVGILNESELWGVTASGALSNLGLALLEWESADPTPPSTGRRTVPRDPLASALTAALPEPVDEVLLQGDLTAVVLGRPSESLATLLTQSSIVESRGAGLTSRFSMASITRAFDSGWTAGGLVSALTQHSAAPLPQSLEYLIADAARQHGRVRVGAATSYLRVSDEVTAAALLADHRLISLGVFPLSATVLAAPVPAAELLAAVRAANYAPVVEAPDGTLIPLASLENARTPRQTTSSVFGSSARNADGNGSHGILGASRNIAPSFNADRRLSTHDLSLIAARLRRSMAAPPDDDRAHIHGPHTLGDPAASTPQPKKSAADDPLQEPPAEGTFDPVEALGLLREAAASGDPVRIEMIGPRGVPVTRDVVAISVVDGRVRARDLARDSELTVAVHRLVRATLLGRPTAEPDSIVMTDLLADTVANLEEGPA